MKKSTLLGMGIAFTIAGTTGYMLYKNMDHETKKGVGRAIKRKKNMIKDDLEDMM